MELEEMIYDWEERYNNSYFDEIVDFLEKLPNSSKIDKRFECNLWKYKH